MSRHSISFTAETNKVFVANPKQISGYKATIQNNTNQTITITVTNEDVQNGSSTYGTPAAGAVAITARSIAMIDEPYQAWTLTAGVAATGTVDITEMG